MIMCYSTLKWHLSTLKWHLTVVHLCHFFYANMFMFISILSLKAEQTSLTRCRSQFYFYFYTSDYWSYQNFSSHLIPYYECQSDGNNKNMEINVNIDFRHTKKHYHNDYIFKIQRSCTTCSTLYNHVFTLCSVLAFIKCIYFFILITSYMVSLFFWWSPTSPSSVKMESAFLGSKCFIIIDFKWFSTISCTILMSTPGTNIHT